MNLMINMQKVRSIIGLSRILKLICKWSEIKFSDLPVKPYSMASIHQGFQRKFYGLYNQ